MSTGTHPVLGDWIDGGAVKLDLPRLLETRMLIQAASGGGKSRALRRLLESTSGKVQQIIIDPEGEFASLREKHDLVICAAQGGDAATHPRTAALLGRRLLEVEASAVLDISELRARERHAFVRLLLESLIEAPKSLRHSALIVIDEIQIYAPEKGQGESEASGAVIDLATRGRKRGLALIGATQRISMLHKSVAGECKNRLIGGTSLDVDVRRAAFDLGMPATEALAKLRALEPGHFFVFGPALGQLEPREMVTGEVLTTHPKVGHRQWTVAPKPTAAIVALLPKLSDLPKEAETEARTLEDLRRELATARRELAAAKRATPAVAAVSDKATAAELRAANGLVKRLREALETLMKFVVKINAEGFAENAGADPEDLRKAIDSAVGQAVRLIDQKLDGRAKALQALQREGGRLIANIQKLIADESVTIALDVKHSEPFTVKAAAPSVRPARVTNGHAEPVGDLGRCESKILSVLAQFPEGCAIGKLTLLTGYRKSGGFLNSLSTLRTAGLIEGANTAIMRITDEGMAQGPFPELPQGDGLLRYWLGHSSFGVCERKILTALSEHPDGMEIADLCGETGYAKSGGFLNSLSVLRTAGVLVGKNTETMRVSPEILP